MCAAAAWQAHGKPQQPQTSPRSAGAGLLSFEYWIGCSVRVSGAHLCCIRANADANTAKHTARHELAREGPWHSTVQPRLQRFDRGLIHRAAASPLTIHACTPSQGHARPGGAPPAAATLPSPAAAAPSTIITGGGPDDGRGIIDITPKPRRSIQQQPPQPRPPLRLCPAFRVGRRLEEAQRQARAGARRATGRRALHG